MAFRIEVAKSATKNLDRVDSETRRRLLKRLEELAVDPFEKSKQLVNYDPPHRSSRVGDWRIVFYVNTDSKVILVVRIEPRGSAY